MGQSCPSSAEPQRVTASTGNGASFCFCLPVLRRRQDGGLFPPSPYVGYPFLMFPELGNLCSPYLPNGALTPGARPVSQLCVAPLLLRKERPLEKELPFNRELYPLFGLSCVACSFLRGFARRSWRVVTFQSLCSLCVRLKHSSCSSVCFGKRFSSMADCQGTTGRLGHVPLTQDIVMDSCSSGGLATDGFIVAFYQTNLLLTFGRLAF